MTLKLAVLASGRGSNLATFIKRARQGRLEADIVLVLSNNPAAPALELARQAGIATWSDDHRVYGSREDFDRNMLEAIARVGADTVALAGYMRILSAPFIQAFPGRILNIHPALLPAFPGGHSLRDALDYGARLSGCSVHFVDEKMDNGPLVIQAAVPLYNEEQQDDEARLHARIQEYEHRIYPQALQWLAEGRLRLEGRKVRLLPSAQPGFVLSAPAGAGLVCPPLEKF
ncbi:MAG: phosphoribosylglycinamide formyltransferase [Deltaproteobacteria bacterium]|jgi:phosphoribosylglycinamide formyltransferase-1|nr:phosphoribosylglycinamide formyltransferase [Deltaproteobacteria bacterium]